MEFKLAKEAMKTGGGSSENEAGTKDRTKNHNPL
jgi:hypothetical protein